MYGIANIADLLHAAVARPGMGCSGLSILEESEARVNVWQSLNIDTILLGKKTFIYIENEINI